MRILAATGSRTATIAPTSAVRGMRTYGGMPRPLAYSWNVHTIDNHSLTSNHSLITDVASSSAIAEGLTTTSAHPVVLLVQLLVVQHPGVLPPPVPRGFRRWNQ